MVFAKAKTMTTRQLPVVVVNPVVVKVVAPPVECAVT
jgi:hypothetical protein